MSADAAALPPLLAVEGLTIALPPGADRTLAAEEVSLGVGAGETLCLVGESGSGKTVVGQAILGMLPPALPVSAGRVLLGGEPLPPQRDPAFLSLRGPRITVVFQDAAASLDPVMRVGRQIEEVMEVHGVPRAGRRERAVRALAEVALPDPEGAARAYPHELSGGQAQRVAIAMALLLEPELLIADEPTTALDVTTQAEILALLGSLKAAHGMGVLFVTHDFGVVEEIADRVAVMREGRIVEAGAAAQILSAPRHPYTRALLAAAHPEADRRARGADAPVMEARDLSLTYRSGPFWRRRETAAVRSVSLSVGRGRTLGVVGESGSGKSSLARLLLRLEEPEAGAIRFEGRDVTRLRGAELRALRRAVQVVLQDPWSALDPRQPVCRAIAEGPVIHGTPRAEALARAGELLALTGLSPQAGDRLPHEFSGGQRQRICIARALALEPRLLIADEAVSALDVQVRAQILDLFAQMQARFGFAMVFITHDLRVARAISDDLLVMRAGAVVEHGPAERVFASPRHPYTKALLASAPGGAEPDPSPERVPA